MSKTAYYTRPLKGGSYFDVMVVPDDFGATYPITLTPIPEALQAAGCVPRYRWETASWEDASQDAQVAAQQAKDKLLTDTATKAADAKAGVVTAQADISTVQDAIVELAQAVLPSTDTTADTAQEVQA